MSGACSPFVKLFAAIGALLFFSACSTVNDTTVDDSTTPPLADPEPAPTPEPTGDDADATDDTTDDSDTSDDDDDSSSSDPTPTDPIDPVDPIDEDFDTVEYQSQSALDQIGALAAYEVGGDGADIIVGIIDSGIDVSNTEFEGRIHEESADLVIDGVVSDSDVRPGGPDLQDSDGHGTPVASIIGAARDDVGVHGVAPEAELLIFRADDETDDDSLLGAAVIEGVERSAVVGADVLNFSFGSDSAGVRGLFQAIFEFTRDNDIVVATAAGNEGEADPNASALGALDVTGDPTVIVVGSVDSSGNISGFSNQAGAAADIYLVAPGELIQTTYIGAAAGDTRFFSGTSAATPNVAGAAALIRQLWPALSASEVVDILFSSATDLGDVGTDTVYGRGLLNLEAAVEPLGDVTTGSISGVTTSTEDLTVGLPSGIGVSFVGMPKVVVFDSYNRDFRLDLSNVVQRSAPNSFDPQGILNPFERRSTAAHRINNRLTANFRLSSRENALTDFETHRTTRLVGAETAGKNTENILAMSLTQELAEGQRLTVSQGFSASAMDNATLPIRRSPFLSQSFFSDAFLSLSHNTVASRLKTNIAPNIDVDFLASHSDGDNLFSHQSAVSDGYPRRNRVINVRAGLGFHLQNLQLRIEQGVRQEIGAVLDAVFVGDTRASTVYAAVDGDWSPASNWRLKGRYAVGQTFASTDGLGDFVDRFSDVRATQFSLALARSDIFGKGDNLWIGASKPLEVQSGVIELILPTGYDYMTDTISYTHWSAPLGADPGQYDLEAGYRLSLGPYGSVDFNVIHQLLPAYDIQSSTALVLRSGFEF